jgi:hypothetical protein
MLIRHSLAATLLVAAAIGCSSTSAPANNTPQTTGVFNLVLAESQSLPAAVFEGTIVTEDAPAFHLRVLATSGSFSIDGSGHYEHRVNQDVFIDGALSGRPRYSDHGECTRNGAQLQCTSTYLEGVELAATLGNNRVTIAQDLVGEGKTATYVYQWTSAL